MSRYKYFKKKTDALKALSERDPGRTKGLQIFKMQEGTRHAGEYAVCTELEYLNTY